ncbi:putative membrane protein [Phyllobacterium leguminum]|uniref:Putative membrane protein n=2 Tax=Phyllobacterium leguminum TaxID=314237 RepID=A0A318T5C6_9HYPH|nr:putative membrane protein [Phyllobacterium leguminum]
MLVPHRSLGRTGFLVLMAVLIAGWIICGVFFLSLGAWPVFGFFGLDVLIVYLAFRLNYRAARAREEISVSRTALDIRQIAPSGHTREHRFNPFWARFRIARHDEIGITAMNVEGEGRRVAIGSFLNPDDRESFASAFTKALATAKGR